MPKYFHLAGEDLRQALPKLGDLKDPPKSLYIKGNWDETVFSRAVAVVGSRRITNYGRQVVEKLVPQLVAAGKTIISGFMYGVDQYAHDVCMENGGKTVAILGYGIKIELNGYEKKLAGKIIESGGLVISEWESQISTLWTFPVRNRIVAALADEVYVIEAAIKSGSLLTANEANRLNRTVYAIPGPITSRTSMGTNNLIATGKAKMWLGETKIKNVKDYPDNPIICALQDESLSANDLAKKLKAPIAKIGAQLSLLTVTGQLLEREGKYYIGDADKT